MSPFFCHSCGPHHARVTRTASADALATSFQTGRREKHMMPNTASPLHGIFTTSVDTVAYQGLVQQTLERGYLEVDGRSRMSFIMRTDTSAGDLYRYGRFLAPAEAVQVVQPDHPDRRHLYPAGWPVQSRFCADCAARLS